jgi:hypothetical protein
MPGDTYFLWNSIPNLLWILGLIYYLRIRKNIGAVMVAMLMYLSLHGGYAIFAAATGDGINTLNDLHYQRSDPGVKLVGACFLVYCSILLLFRMQNPLSSLRQGVPCQLGVYFLLALFLAFMVYGAVNLPGIAPEKMQTVLKESVFATGMWIGTILFAVAIRQGVDYFSSRRREWLAALMILAVVMLIGGFYEIITGVVWAGTYYVTGFSYRASSTLFNPNVLGFWCSLLVALISLIFHLGWISRRATFVAMAGSVCLLILSSSRSGLMLALVNLFAVTAILVSGRKYNEKSLLEKVWPLIAFILSFMAWTLLIELLSPGRFATIDAMRANLYRFLQLPVDIFWIFVMKLFFPLMDKLRPLLTSLLESLPSSGFADMLSHSVSNAFESMTRNINTAASSYEAGKMMESVNGRILLEYISDNSFMSIYAVGGSVAIAVWLVLWVFLFWAGIRKNMVCPGVFSAHSLGGLILCFVSGFFLRTPQLFPVWIFLSMILGACVCWWSTPNPGAGRATLAPAEPATPSEPQSTNRQACAS